MSKILAMLSAKFRRLCRCENGQDAAEYALLVAMIALVCISGVQGTANSLNNMFGEISQVLNGAQQQQGTPPPAPGQDHGRGHGGRDGGGGHGGRGWWH